MNYQDTLDYLFSQLPMFTRIGAAAFKKDLTNTLALCELLNKPHTQFKTIHVAGTNGKGSTSHMLAAILQQAGYKTGLYTSPHLKDFRERIRINGQMIPEQEVIDFVAKYREHFDAIKPSFFEWTVALCFDYFARMEVDVAVIETGLGGRLDSTNVITPQLSIITNIGWDHMDMLGDTLPKIAAEKAGIIKPGVPVIIGEYQEETWPVFTQKASAENATITLADDVVQLQSIQFEAKGIEVNATINGAAPVAFTCDLPGLYQQHNIKTVLASVSALQQIGYNISNAHIINALGAVKSLTGLGGRWQVLQERPLMVADTGHNVNGLHYVLAQIKQQSYEHLHVVLGMVRDKDISKVLQLLPTDATYYFTNAAIPRALPAEELQAMAEPFGLKGMVFESVVAARDAALKAASPNDMIFIGGSTFIVAEAV